MNKSLLAGFWRCLLPVPPQLWQGQISKNAIKLDAGLDFMTPEHHLVRNYVVREIPTECKPLPPDTIARDLDLPVDQTVAILDELEKNMTFLFRNESGEVTWAYPVTADKTPHRITLSSGEGAYAA